MPWDICTWYRVRGRVEKRVLSLLFGRCRGATDVSMNTPLSNGKIQLVACSIQGRKIIWANTPVSYGRKKTSISLNFLLLSPPSPLLLLFLHCTLSPLQVFADEYPTSSTYSTLRKEEWYKEWWNPHVSRCLSLLSMRVGSTATVLEAHSTICSYPGVGRHLHSVLGSLILQQYRHTLAQTTNNEH